MPSERDLRLRLKRLGEGVESLTERELIDRYFEMLVIFETLVDQRADFGDAGLRRSIFDGVSPVANEFDERDRLDGPDLTDDVLALATLASEIREGEFSYEEAAEYLEAEIIETERRTGVENPEPFAWQDDVLPLERTGSFPPGVSALREMDMGPNPLMDVSADEVDMDSFLPRDNISTDSRRDVRMNAPSTRRSDGRRGGGGGMDVSDMIARARELVRDAEDNFLGTNPTVEDLRVAVERAEDLDGDLGDSADVSGAVDELMDAIEQVEDLFRDRASGDTSDVSFPSLSDGTGRREMDSLDDRDRTVDRRNPPRRTSMSRNVDDDPMMDRDVDQTPRDDRIDPEQRGGFGDVPAGMDGDDADAEKCGEAVMAAMTAISDHCGAEGVPMQTSSGTVVMAPRDAMDEVRNMAPGDMDRQEKLNFIEQSPWFLDWARTQCNTAGLSEGTTDFEDCLLNYFEDVMG